MKLESASRVRIYSRINIRVIALKINEGRLLAREHLNMLHLIHGTLPLHIRQSKGITIFKRALKAHFFKRRKALA